MGGEEIALTPYRQVVFILWCIEVVSPQKADKKISLTNTAGPATYTLPPMLGCKTAVAPSAPNYTLQGRGKTGSFHEDSNKVYKDYMVPKEDLTTPPKKPWNTDFSVMWLFLQTPCPGPAAYKVVDPSIYRQKPPQYSIKGRNFAPEENTSKPGPGAHYPEHVRNILFL